MTNWIRWTVVVLLLSAFPVMSTAQQAKKTGVLDPQGLEKVVPNSFFFDDQIAPVQMRNAVAIRTQDGKIIAAGLVDSSGYAADIASKYQGFLITSKKISIEDKTLTPGQYGFGFTKDGNFRVMDAGANDILVVKFTEDNELKRAVPLKAVANGADFRLYAGKKYVTLKTQ
jgi:hypothetical protein